MKIKFWVIKVNGIPHELYNAQQFTGKEVYSLAGQLEDEGMKVKVETKEVEIEN